MSYQMEKAMKQAKEWTKALIITLMFTAAMGGLLEMWFRQQGL